MINNKFLYYISRAAQRAALFMIIGATIIHWIIVISITVNTQFISSIDNIEYKNTQQTNELISRVIDTQSLVVLRWFIISAVITSLLLFIKRFRKYEKTLLVDSTTILILCMFSVVFSQMIVRAFISSL
jgi:hypothetical protein